MIQRAVGVHEWCEIRLIRVKGRLALCEESGRIWHSWWVFWLLFAHTKSDKRKY